MSFYGTDVVYMSMFNFFINYFMNLEDYITN